MRGEGHLLDVLDFPEGDSASRGQACQISNLCSLSSCMIVTQPDRILTGRELEPLVSHSHLSVKGNIFICRDVCHAIPSRERVRNGRRSGRVPQS